MKLILIVLTLLSLCTPTFAQDDCPAGHIRNPQISPLDHDYMLRAFQASHKGIFGYESPCTPGSGVHDCEYYIGASNHYGVYGDDQCHAGWSGYWESWLSVGHGDLSLVQSPARFLPTPPQPQPAPQPVPVPVPTPIPAPIPSVDLSGLTILVQQCIASINQTDKDVNDGRRENQAWQAEVKSVWQQIGAPLLKYVVPAITAYLAGKKL
jgi:hypothetical protein